MVRLKQGFDSLIGLQWKVNQTGVLGSPAKTCALHRVGFECSAFRPWSEDEQRARLVLKTSTPERGAGSNPDHSATLPLDMLAYLCHTEI